MPTPITLYGIPNCDTVKKARQWLDGHGITYHFHDFRKDGLVESQVKHWIDALGWESVLNRKGTTWRQLPEDTRNRVNAINIISLLMEHPTLIKRPVLETSQQILCGFNADTYKVLLK